MIVTLWRGLTYYRVSTNANSNETTQDKTYTHTRTQRKIGYLHLKYELLNIPVPLQIVFAAETRLAEGQWLEEQVNM
jgi:hypothetical protein